MRAGDPGSAGRIFAHLTRADLARLERRGPSPSGRAFHHGRGNDPRGADPAVERRHRVITVVGLVDSMIYLNRCFFADRRRVYILSPGPDRAGFGNVWGRPRAECRSVSGETATLLNEALPRPFRPCLPAGGQRDPAGRSRVRPAFQVRCCQDGRAPSRVEPVLEVLRRRGGRGGIGFEGWRAATATMRSVFYPVRVRRC